VYPSDSRDKPIFTASEPASSKEKPKNADKEPASSCEQVRHQGRECPKKNSIIKVLEANEESDRKCPTPRENETLWVRVRNLHRT
jgi:hypothetical protein